MDEPIVIIGAGIAGLALALRCAQNGLAVEVFEARQLPAEAGAGIQLGPNATHTLQKLGVSEALDGLVCAPDAIDLFSSTHVSANPLNSVPLGAHIAARHGNPYWVAHRRDVHGALLDRAIAMGVDITHGARVEEIVTNDGTVRIAGQAPRRASAIICADGLWSQLRARVAGVYAPSYSGYSAARTTVPADQVPTVLSQNRVAAWMSQAGHLVHYPIRDGREVAVVCVMRSAQPPVGWGVEIASHTVAAGLKAIATGLPTHWACLANWRAWPLLRPTPVPRWYCGRACLIGDAAHPVLPYLAQGGALALEDAALLADLLSTWRDEPHQAFPVFARHRMARAERVQRASQNNGRIYHMPAPLNLARDLTIAARSGESLLADFDWLYGWKPEATGT